MSQKAEVKVVVNTAEARAALLRLEEEALRVEAEVNRTGKKAKAGNYKSAKNAAAAGHAEHLANGEGIGGASVGAASAAGVAGGAVAAKVAGRLEKANLNSKGAVRNFLTADPAAAGFNKAQYRTSFASYLSHAEKINPNLARALASAHTNFFVMEGLDRDRLMAASMKVAKSRMYNMYGWWVGKDPREKWMNIYSNDVSEQIRSNYNAAENATKIKQEPPIKGGKFSILSRFKRIGQAAISRGFGMGGTRAVLSGAFGIGVVGMAIKQLGEGARKRIDVLRKGGISGYSGHVLATVGKAIWEFGEDVGYSGWKLIGELGGLLYNAVGQSGMVKDAQQFIADVDRFHEIAKKKRVSVDKWNPFLMQAAKEVGDHLTEKGRFGTPEENQRWALKLMQEAQDIAAKRAGIGNQG